MRKRCRGSPLRIYPWQCNLVLPVGEGAVIVMEILQNLRMSFCLIKYRFHITIMSEILYGGYKAHMGMFGISVITSNVKSDKKLVVVKSPEGQIETGIKKFGAMLGDEVEDWLRNSIESGKCSRKPQQYLPAVQCQRIYVPANSIYKKSRVK